MFRSPISVAHLSSVIRLIVLIGLILSFAGRGASIPRCSIHGFSTATNYAVPTSNAVVATGDFNRDGRSDLAVTSVTVNGGVSVLLNDGAGRFISPTLYPTGIVQYEVITADFNNDSKLDIATSNFYSDTVSVLLGNGNGTFNPAITSASGGPSPWRMVAADFNHNGYLDLAISNNPIEGGGNIAILSGDGTGRLIPASTLPGCSFLRGADFNRDGNVDLLGVTTSPLSVYLSNHQGGFSGPIAVGTDLPTGVPSFAIDDFNSDDIPDVAAIVGTNNLQVAMLRGNGDGTFTATQTYPVGMQNGAHLATGDIDGDGEVDLVGAASETTTGRGFVLFGTGTGVFSGSASYYVNGMNPSQLAVADFNGDGRADIVTDMNNAPSISVVLSTCLNPTPRYDFDADGRSDISVYRPQNGNWYALQSTDGSLLSLPWGLGTDRIVPGDYDGDSKTDVAVFRPSIGAWFTLRSSNSTFVAQSWGISTDVPVTADYDADGRTDLAVYRSGAWYVLRSSDGSVMSEFFGLASDQPMPGDYDRDGKADIAVYRPSEGVWYMRLSSNNALRIRAFGSAGDIPVTGDFDGDGMADPAVYRPSTGTWYTLVGQFQLVHAQNWGVSTDTPVPADYDGDGKTDHAVYRASQGTWYILRSSDSSLAAQPFGLPADLPIEAGYHAP